MARPKLGYLVVSVADRSREGLPFCPNAATGVLPARRRNGEQNGDSRSGHEQVAQVSGDGPAGRSRLRRELVTLEADPHLPPNGAAWLTGTDGEPITNSSERLTEARHGEQHSKRLARPRACRPHLHVGTC